MKKKIIISVTAICIIAITFFTLPIMENINWYIAKTTNTSDSYLNFTNDYPKSNKIPELDDILYELILQTPEEIKYVVYKNFSIREQPKLRGKLIQKLMLGDTVKVIDRSEHKNKIELDGYIANDFWYNVELNSGVTGWIFGGGLRTSYDYYYTCNLYYSLFPNGRNIKEMTRKFKLADCACWQEIKIYNDQYMYKEYTKIFPEGIYYEDALIMTKVSDPTSLFNDGKYCYKLENTNFTETISLQMDNGEISGSGYGGPDKGLYGWEFTFYEKEKKGNLFKITIETEVEGNISKYNEKWRITKSSLIRTSKDRTELYHLIDCE